jgi:hypothetical protein
MNLEFALARQRLPLLTYECEQFCCSGVTGTIAALSGGVDMGRMWRMS